MAFNKSTVVRAARITRIGNATFKQSLYFVHYNFCRIHKTLKVTPAMEAGLTDTLHDIEWIISLIDARAKKPGRPKLHGTKKNISN